MIVIKNETNQAKKIKWIVLLMNIKYKIQKHLHHVKISKIMLVVLMIRHVHMMILQVIVMVGQELWMIKM